MGLLDQFLQTAGEGGTPADPAQHAALYSEVAKIVAQEGGVPGIAQKFEQNGMGGLFSGLLANPPAAAAPAVPAPDATADPNAATGAPAPAAASASPLTGGHIVQLLGQDRIQEIAGKVGLTPDQVATGISTMLPLIVSHLAPQGNTAGTPTAASEIEGALFGELKSKLFG
jgi:uncharacterized protein YidB (DUF937 family)